MVEKVDRVLVEVEQELFQSLHCLGMVVMVGFFYWTMLNRMRDLAVQASNTGANDATARGAAQQELAQLRDEVDRIGNTTAFGDTKLLNGSYGVSAANSAAMTGRSFSRMMVARAPPSHRAISTVCSPRRGGGAR